MILSDLVHKWECVRRTYCKLFLIYRLITKIKKTQIHYLTFLKSWLVSKGPSGFVLQVFVSHFIAIGPNRHSIPHAKDLHQILHISPNHKILKYGSSWTHARLDAISRTFISIRIVLGNRYNFYFKADSFLPDGFHLNSSESSDNYEGLLLDTSLVTDMTHIHHIN